MDFYLLGKASVIGLLIAAPVGPIGLLCMQRTLSGGLKIGLMSGLGAASADAVYGAVGALGLTSVINLFTSLSEPLAIFGAIFLAWMGLGLLRTQKVKQAAVSKASTGVSKAFASTLLLTLANPMTMLSFVAIFAGLSGNLSLTPETASTMVAGVFLGSAIWWLILSGTVALVRHKITDSFQVKISKGAGVILLCFAGWQVQSVLITT